MAVKGIFSVNWKNPMLLGAAHLQTADWLAAQARSWLARAVADPCGHYGLTPPLTGQGRSLEMDHEHEALHLGVTINSLAALAPDGTPLLFDEMAYPQLRGTLTAGVDLPPNVPEPVRLGIVVRPATSAGGDEGSIIEVGEPDPAEEPPRLPLQLPALELQIEPAAFSCGSALKVAELVWNGATITPAEDYLPPCLTAAAWPDLGRLIVDLRQQIRRIRELLRAAAAGETEVAADSQVKPALLPALMAVAGLEEQVPLKDPRIHPHQAWLAVMQALRVMQTLLGAQPMARDLAVTDLIQPGKLASGNAGFLEDMRAYLRTSYDHENTGPSLRIGRDLLADMHEVLGFLLGAAPEQAPEAPENEFIYKEKKYLEANYGVRIMQINEPEPWHVCHLREMSIPQPKGLLLVVDRSLLEENPRANAGLWMVDRFEKIIANMFRVNVDSSFDPNRVVVQYGHIGEPTVESVSIATRGLLDLSGLGAEPDERLRVYFEQ